MLKLATGSYMIGKLHDTLFAFDVADVEGVSEYVQEKITPLESELAMGVMLYHFQRIPLMNTNKILGLPMPDGRNKIVNLTLRVSHGLIGIPLDEMLCMVQANPDEIQPLGAAHSESSQYPFIGIIPTKEGHAIVVDKNKIILESNLVEILNQIYKIKDSFATNYVFNLGVVEHIAKKREIEMHPFEFNPNQSLSDVKTEDVYKDMIACLHFLGIPYQENKDRTIIAADVYLVSKQISKILEAKVGSMETFRKKMKLRSQAMEDIFNNLDREIHAGDVFQLSEALKDGLDILKNKFQKAS